MSLDAIKLVRDSGIKPSGRKFVMMALADYADESFECFPHINTIAEYTAQSERAVRRHLQDLEDEGIISRKRRRREDGTLGGYRFVINQRQICPEAKLATGQKRPEPPAKLAAQEPPEITTNLNNIRRAHPIAENWRPDAQLVELARSEGLTEEDIACVIEEFIEYWRPCGTTKRGQKTARGWQLAFRNRLKTVAKHYGSKVSTERGRAASEQRKSAWLGAVEELGGGFGSYVGPERQGSDHGGDGRPLRVAGTS